MKKTYNLRGKFYTAHFGVLHQVLSDGSISCSFAILMLEKETGERTILTYPPRGLLPARYAAYIDDSEKALELTNELVNLGLAKWSTKVVDQGVFRYRECLFDQAFLKEAAEESIFGKGLFALYLKVYKPTTAQPIVFDTPEDMLDLIFDKGLALFSPEEEIVVSKDTDAFMESYDLSIDSALEMLHEINEDSLDWFSTRAVRTAHHENFYTLGSSARKFCEGLFSKKWYFLHEWNGET